METMAELDAGARITEWNKSGDRMAVGFADGCIEVWIKQFPDGSSLNRIFKWKAHEGSIVKLSWGSPEYGVILASCSEDGSVSVWEEAKEKSETKWRECSQLANNTYALDLQFGNCSSGLKLITSCVDGHVRIYETSDSIELRKWQLEAVFPNVMDVTEFVGKCVCSHAAISWKPPIGAVQQPIFAVGFCTDSPKFSSTKIWEFVEAHRRWYPVAELPNNHEETVRSISWSNNLGRPFEVIAVATGKIVSIWHLELNGQKVQRAAELDHGAEVWQVDWDMSGMTLATCAADEIVRIWQSGLDGIWHQQAAFPANT